MAGSAIHEYLADGAPGQVPEDAVARVRRLVPGLVLTAELSQRAGAAALVEASRTADTVVLGARGRGHLAIALLGSVSSSVAVQAQCPVVVVKDGEDPARPRDAVVVGVDASEGAAVAAATSAKGRKEMRPPTSVSRCTRTAW